MISRFDALPHDDVSSPSPCHGVVVVHATQLTSKAGGMSTHVLLDAGIYAPHGRRERASSLDGREIEYLTVSRMYAVMTVFAAINVINSIAFSTKVFQMGIHPV